ncbi:NlpC/P60 family protein [Maribacter sp. 2307ULW6-5]|uniref:C40 family peptidase n=1 Tax=Maribacter sp. 2307ULW6-5 TaxID=3386275 RepID=UPI0039BD0A6E
MEYGICSLNLVPVRQEANKESPMTNQLLFGEFFKVLENRKHWSRIRNSYDGDEGWIPKLQYHQIDKETYEFLEHIGEKKYTADLISYVSGKKGGLTPILLGSCMDGAAVLSVQHEGSLSGGKQDRNALVSTALLYLNAPELMGGKTPFGLDAAGLAQMVYRINGHYLQRSVAQQAAQGTALSFVEESAPGDLAFFDDAQGNIDHVGLIMENNYIVHVHGKVRVDRLDHTGIFNNEDRRYTHQLRVIKKIIP